MNALLMDYAPYSSKERKLVVMVMREGVVPQLMKIANERGYSMGWVYHQLKARAEKQALRNEIKIGGKK